MTGCSPIFKFSSLRRNARQLILPEYSQNTTRIIPTYQNIDEKSMENPRRINEKIDEKSMKNRWKIVQNRAWRRVGPSWGLLGCLVGILERLGSILWASWERLGACWGRPGGIPEREGDPTWTPGRDQNRSKIDPKSHWFFDRFLDSILIPEWLQNGSPNL